MCKNDRTDQDAVWIAEMRGSREHALLGNVDSRVKMHFWGVRPTEKHRNIASALKYLVVLILFNAINSLMRKRVN